MLKIFKSYHFQVCMNRSMTKDIAKMLDLNFCIKRLTTHRGRKKIKSFLCWFIIHSFRFEPVDNIHSPSLLAPLTSGNCVSVYVVMWCSTAMRGCQEVGGRMDTGAWLVWRLGHTTQRSLHHRTSNIPPPAPRPHPAPELPTTQHGCIHWWTLEDKHYDKW